MSYVYAITDGTNIKIGVSQRPTKRLKTLATGNANNLKLIGYFPGGYALEKEIHAAHKKIRSNGEWLESSPQLLEYLNSVISDKLIVNDNGTIKTYLKISKEIG